MLPVPCMHSWWHPSQVNRFMFLVKYMRFPLCKYQQVASVSCCADPRVSHSNSGKQLGRGVYGSALPA